MGSAMSMRVVVAVLICSLLSLGDCGPLSAAEEEKDPLLGVKMSVWAMVAKHIKLLDLELFPVAGPGQKRYDLSLTYKDTRPEGDGDSALRSFLTIAAMEGLLSISINKLELRPSRSLREPRASVIMNMLADKEGRDLFVAFSLPKPEKPLSTAEKRSAVRWARSHWKVRKIDPSWVVLDGFLRQ